MATKDDTAKPNKSATTNTAGATLLQDVNGYTPSQSVSGDTKTQDGIASPKDPIIIKVDDSSEETRLFSITERLFDDLSKNPKFNIAQVGGLSISLPDGGALKLTKENVEKITVLHLLFKKLLEDEPEDLQKKYRQEYGPKIGKLVQSAGDEPLNIQSLVKELFEKLPPEKRTQKPAAPTPKP